MQQLVDLTKCKLHSTDVTSLLVFFVIKTRHELRKSFRQLVTMQRTVLLPHKLLSWRTVYAVERYRMSDVMWSRTVVFKLDAIFDDFRR